MEKIDRPDLRNAFNTANLDLILEKLRNLLISVYLRNILSEYLKAIYVRSESSRLETSPVFHKDRSSDTI